VCIYINVEYTYIEIFYAWLRTNSFNFTFVLESNTFSLALFVRTFFSCPHCSSLALFFLLLHIHFICLSLFWLFLSSVLRTRIYDRDPIDALKFEAPLAKLKEHLAAPGGGYLEGLVERYLLSNTHRVTMELKPDKELEHRQEEEEAAKLQQVRVCHIQQQHCFNWLPW